MARMVFFDKVKSISVCNRFFIAHCSLCVHRERFTVWERPALCIVWKPWRPMVERRRSAAHYLGTHLLTWSSSLNGAPKAAQIFLYLNTQYFVLPTPNDALHMAYIFAIFYSDICIGNGLCFCFLCENTLRKWEKSKRNTQIVTKEYSNTHFQRKT